LSALFLDLGCGIYASVGVVLLLSRRVAGTLEGPPDDLVAKLLLAGTELGIVVHGLGVGPGPGASGLRLVASRGGPVGLVGRLQRLAWLHLTLLPVLAAAWALGPTGPLGIGVWGSLAEAGFALRAAGTAGWLALTVTLASLLCVVADPLGRTPADRLPGAWLVPREDLPAEERVVPWYHQPTWWLVVALTTLTYVVGWRISRIDPREIVVGARSAMPLARSFAVPDMSTLGQCVWAMVETVYLALMATTFAVPVAIVLSFFGARNIMPRTLLADLVYFLMRVFFTIARSVEPIVWAIVFGVWVGLGPFAGMLALFVHSVAALGKMYSEQVESIEPGPVEAIRATGASAVQTVVYAVWPQVVPPFVAFTLYRWDINVRMATVVGLVGGGGIGYLLQQHQQMLHWPQVGMIVWVITLVVWLLDIASARIRERIV
jgi:phosphonate transport system permease protein